MHKLTKAELEKIRERESEKLKKRDIHGKTVHVVVSMGTSGIKAGAKGILNILSDEIDRNRIEDVILTQSGEIKGVEAPAVEIFSPEMGLVVYGGVTKDDALRIVEEHLIKHEILEDKRVQVEE